MLGAVVAWPSIGSGQERYIPSASDFGGVGLLQTRTARFGPDGQFDVGYSFIFPYERYLITLQALPWVEGTFRYTSVTNKNFSGNTITGQTRGSSFKDRGADMKFRLRRESKFLPALAVGLQDTLGTGIFAGEYVVASKRYEDFDFSFGMGWGYAAGSGEIANPFVTFSDVFRSRSSGGAQGGTVPFGAWFSGEKVGLFGGVEYTTPLKGLSFKFEWDPNDYRTETPAGFLPSQSHWNIGANYRAFDWLDLSVGLERGRQVLLRVSLRADVNQPGLPKLDPPPPPLRPRPAPSTPASRQAAGVATNTEVLTVDLASGASGFLRSRAWFGGGLSDRRLVPAETDDWAAKEFAALPALTRPVEVGRPVERTDTFQSSSYEEDSILEFLFENLESNGIFVESFSTSGATATVRTVALPGEAARIKAAGAIFDALPMSLDLVRFVTSETRSTLSRPDVRRAQNVDELFDRLQEKGISVVSVEIWDRQVVLNFRSRYPNWRSETQDAAQIVADHLPPPIDSVRFVRLDHAAGTNYGAPVKPVAALLPLGLQSVSGDENSPPSALSDEDRQLITTRIFEEFLAERFLVEGIQLSRDRATVFVRPLQFREAARNIGRAARVVANNVPASVEEIVIVTMSRGLELNRVLILRKDLESAVVLNGSPEEIWARATIEEPSHTFLPGDAIKNRRRFPWFSWSLGPTIKQHIGSGEDFYIYGVFASLSGSVEVARGLSVNAVARKVIYDQFDSIVTESPSTLQKVRSDIKEYLQQGETSLHRFQTDYLFMPVPNLYARASAGIFEDMYGGYGGEVLYRPFASRIAIGADVNWVRQRAFDQRLTFLPYTVVTGHMNIYYEMPWYNLVGQVHIGQYLARDRGATFQMSRVFDSGVRMGVWATFTTVSFEQFGEGAFDKGFIIAVPFELFSLASSQQHGVFAFRPLTKDGGQRLDVGPRLYDVTVGGNLDGIATNWDRILD